MSDELEMTPIMEESARLMDEVMALTAQNDELRAELASLRARPQEPGPWEPPLYEPKFDDDDEAMRNMALVYEERRHINHTEKCARYYNADSRVACDCGAATNEHTHLFGMWLPEFESTPARWLAFDYCPSCGHAILSAPSGPLSDPDDENLGVHTEAFYEGECYLNEPTR